MNLLFVVRILLFISGLFLCLAVNAKVLSDTSALQNMTHELNLAPWKTYQDLTKQDQSQMSAQYKLWWLVRKGQSENLLYLFKQFQQTVATAQTLITKDTSKEITIYIDLFSGIISQRQGQYQQSQKLLRKAQHAAQEHNFTFLQVLAKMELSYTRSLTELYESSFTEIQQAYVEAFALDNDFLIAKVNETYGAMYGYLHDYAKSIEYYQKALVNYRQLKYPAHEVEAIYGIAATYRYWKKYDLAIEYYQLYQEAIKYSPKNINGKFYAIYGIAMSQAEQGECSKALISIERGLSIEGLLDYKAELYKRRAQCQIKFGQFKAAGTSLDAADKIFTDIPELIGTRWQIEVKKIRAELAQAQGDGSEAYQLLKQYNMAEIAQYKKNASEQLLRVRGALEHERQNVEISLLQQRAKVQQLEFEQQKQNITLQKYIITFAVLSILMVLVFVFFQRQHNKSLLALSITDPLSGLFNRRHIFDYLKKLVDVNYSTKNQVSIMAIDIDDFKQINDLYGHPFGDCVIREIAKIGKDTLRVEDVIGRIGGEEFLCILPRIDASQCKLIARRFVDNVNKHTFAIKRGNSDEQVLNVTISVGIATTSPQTQDSLELYTQADKALYQAKHNGKNCAVQYQKEFDDITRFYDDK